MTEKKKKPPKQKEPKKPLKADGHVKTMKAILSASRVLKNSQQSLKQFMSALLASNPTAHKDFEREHKEFRNREATEDFAAAEVFHVEQV